MMMIVGLFVAHQGEEFVIILPAVMLVGAFFIMRWANQNDETATDVAQADEADLPAAIVSGRRDGDETTR